ncbi:Ca-activated chloride channel family protein [Nocardiopsis sp. Huas11]|uniref:VWA domain-containing protein n=1 Tax=Nocardiopsis sp. Huas11 TaxID=2183912 RepID=UPI000EAF64EE|nr:VWA domain-containing protein [Nocardiopsis sp. Huas11]RKS10061.1 Ca-activated chloride channel family protein [Nocardiopsis sp. Huas11]
MTGNRRLRAVAAATAAAGLLLSGCTPGEGGGADTTLRILAGSEVADLEPLLEEVTERTGVAVEMEYVGTLDGMARVAAGETEDVDAIWFGSNRYLGLLLEDGQQVLAEENPVMLSPVVVGVAESTAQARGWTDGAEVTWADIAQAVAENEFRYGMTNPGASNSGFSALIGVASALADTGTALEVEDVEEVAPELEEFFAGHAITSGSSGWLSDRYADLAAEGDAVPGLINYESVLLSLNESGALPEPLHIVRPADGVVTSDYPLTLLADPSDEAADAYERLVADLASEDTQRQITEQTWRRPATPGVEPAGDAPDLVELPFPTHQDVVDELVGRYFAELRRPTRTVFVLDVSGSMEGERIESLRTSLGALTGVDDQSLAALSQSFHERDEVTLLPFSDEPAEPTTFLLGDEESAVRDDLSERIGGLTADGGTAGYDALADAYEFLDAEEGAEEFFTSVVLMTDGEVNEGMEYPDFRDFHGDLTEPVAGVPTFTVLFGESDAPEMTELAELTGGRVFDAREQSLDTVFREIRGYQ